MKETIVSHGMTARPARGRAIGGDLAWEVALSIGLLLFFLWPFVTRGS